jgi:hypothetical protein
MQITASYLDWPTFSEPAGDDFEDRYGAQMESGEGDVQGVVPLDEEDDWSDSYLAWSSAGEVLDHAVAPDSPWRPFVEHAFLAVSQGEPEPRNDLGCPVDPELLAAILSPESVREVMGPVDGRPLPLTEAAFDAAPGGEGAREVFGAFAPFEAEVRRWVSIWQKAAARGLGISYHLG